MRRMEEQLKVEWCVEGNEKELEW